MQFECSCRGVFQSRPNRFVALCEVENGLQRVHVKNTGRLHELLRPGAEVLLTYSGAADRKTAYDLRCVRSAAGEWVCIDSQVPNILAKEYLPQLLPGLHWLRAEQRYGESRFDFAFETDAGSGYAEVKGVTLLRQGVALFPDAPTERGVRHLRELSVARQAGYQALLLFVIQRKGAYCLRPNAATHAAFAEALREAAAAGVRICAVDCWVDECGTACDMPVPVEF